MNPCIHSPCWSVCPSISYVSDISCRNVLQSQMGSGETERALVGCHQHSVWLWVYRHGGGTSGRSVPGQSRLSNDLCKIRGFSTRDLATVRTVRAQKWFVGLRLENCSAERCMYDFILTILFNFTLVHTKITTERGGTMVRHETRIREVPGSNPMTGQLGSGI